jgi:hypothetical protein
MNESSQQGQTAMHMDETEIFSRSPCTVESPTNQVNGRHEEIQPSATDEEIMATGSVLNFTYNIFDVLQVQQQGDESGAESESYVKLPPLDGIKYFIFFKFSYNIRNR